MYNIVSVCNFLRLTKKSPSLTLPNLDCDFLNKAWFIPKKA